MCKKNKGIWLLRKLSPWFCCHSLAACVSRSYLAGVLLCVGHGCCFGTSLLWTDFMASSCIYEIYSDTLEFNYLHIYLVTITQLPSWRAADLPHRGAWLDGHFQQLLIKQYFTLKFLIWSGNGASLYLGRGISQLYSRWTAK